jgi:transcriptional regulator with XRE-family HTH domain
VDTADELSQFLTSRRAKVTPEQAGLRSSAVARWQGLRREEVASLAGVSVEYYKRLERGHVGGVSDGVLDALADALLLDDAEGAHLIGPRPRRRPGRRQATIAASACGGCPRRRARAGWRWLSAAIARASPRPMPDEAPVMTATRAGVLVGAHPDLVECERRGEVAVGVDLLPAFGELLLGLRERVGAGDEPERRLLFVGDGQQRLGELGGVAALPAVHALPELALGGVALGVVLDRRRA